jgi:hypothetical protein
MGKPNGTEISHGRVTWQTRQTYFELGPLAHRLVRHRRVPREGVVATLRREKGHDIAAACGQLRLQIKRAEGEVRRMTA